MYIHPKFDAMKEAPNHDIAILRLDRNVPIVKGKISPICLPVSNRFIKEIFDRCVFLYSFSSNFFDTVLDFIFQLDLLLTKHQTMSS